MVESLDLPEEQAVETPQTNPVPPLEPATATATVSEPIQDAPAAPPLRENLTMKALLEAGVHFGHQTRRWNPMMKKYIFTQRNGIHIIDLQQTLGMINNVYQEMVDLVAEGGKVLFVEPSVRLKRSFRAKLSAVACCTSTSVGWAVP